MISRRALFAGAAGAVVAASPLGRAMGPQIRIVGAPTTFNLWFNSERMAAEALNLRAYRWVSEDELAERHPYV